MTNESTPDLSSSTPPMMGTLIAIAVGNSRTRVGSFEDKECLNPQSFESKDIDAITTRVQEIIDSSSNNSGDDPTIVIAGVNPKSADEIERAIRKSSNLNIYRFGRDFQIPIRHTLTESGEMTVGQDRLLCALGAYAVLNQACVVIDAGTAVTIDFIDGEGVFHGGAILPGISMMLSSLHEATANLPKLVYSKLDPSKHNPGKQTDEAIMLGVTYAVRGAVRALTERYAEHYQAYPQTIVTGGDMGILEDDELIDSFVPDLQLQGI
ncbi:MAG: type III pantothenate kinase, partial [Phycisphaerales bacterium]|nr:type III pantothenate kinase [Phycisphaerales bacterium]